MNRAQGQVLLPVTKSDGLPLRGEDIVCVGFAEWVAELPTNQHHLMSRLSQANRILFVESLGLRRPQLSIRDARRLWRRLRDGLRGLREVDGVHVLSPLTLPLHSHPLARALNRFLLRRQVGRAVARLGLYRPVLWGYVPQAVVLMDALDPTVSIYHCVDDLAAQKGIHAASFRAAELSFASRADIVLASSPALSTRLRQVAKFVVDVPNVADIGFFATALDPGPVDPALARLPRPRIVFTGAIVATKLDFGWLADLAQLRPAWSFALVGPVGLGDPGTDVSALRGLPNVHLLGSRPYQSLPTVLRGADAALIPYALNPLTASVFPMKVYEYLAAGLPVVATPLPALRGLSGVTIARDVESAVRALEYLIGEDSANRRRERSASTAGHSWSDRLAEIGDAVLSISQTAAPGRSVGDLVIDLQNA